MAEEEDHDTLKVLRKRRELTPLNCCTIFECIYFQIQVHHVVPVQEGHSGEDLLGQPDHIFLCKGLVIVGNTLVKDFAPSGAARREEEGDKWREKKKDGEKKGEDLICA